MCKVNGTDEKWGKLEGAEQRKEPDKPQSGKQSLKSVEIHGGRDEQSEIAQESDWRELLRLAQQGDARAMEQMVKNNIGLIHMVLKRMGSMAAKSDSSSSFDREDLFQVGAVGLVSAIQRFDLSTDYSFSTYAVPLIIGEIRRYLRDDGMVHVGRRIKENAHIIAKCKDQITRKNCREPSLQEISSATGLSQDEIVLALGAVSGVESIHRPLGDGDARQTLEDILEDENNTDSRMIDRITVQNLLEGLPDREGSLMRLRYLDGRTQSETAQILGMSQVSVSRLEKKILVKLRGRMR